MHLLQKSPSLLAMRYLTDRCSLQIAQVSSFRLHLSHQSGILIMRFLLKGASPMCDKCGGFGYVLAYSSTRIMRDYCSCKYGTLQKKRVDNLVVGAKKLFAPNTET